MNFKVSVTISYCGPSFRCLAFIRSSKELRTIAVKDSSAVFKQLHKNDQISFKKLTVAPEYAGEVKMESRNTR